MTVIFARVEYGKKNIPKSKREYRIVEIDNNLVPLRLAPVGTRTEIRKWAKKHGLKPKIIEEKTDSYYLRKKLGRLLR